MDINELKALIAVADHGSLKAAARATGIDRGTLRRRIDALEARFAVPLVIREAHGTELSHVGQDVVIGARRIVEQAQRMVSRAHGSVEPRGELTVRAPAGMPASIFAMAAKIAAETMPQVCMTFVEVDDPLSDGLDRVDLVVHWGPDTTGEAWRTFEVLQAPLKLLASPAYLVGHGSPPSLAAALDHHRILAWAAPGMPGDVVLDTQGRPLAFSPSVVCASPVVLFHMAAMGAGIALVVEGGFPIAGLEPDALVEVLPGAIGQKRSLYVSYRYSLHADPRVAAVCDLIERFVAAMGHVT